ncbi:PREDICTED: uncharacterized protein LOC109346566 [Lupinus angustifolius]|uniref:uncharacterized protein LOC109346566 n=1 Tax=Lupinus angustifolius TaxID=3871 RepID=UPI00092F25AC|nr:PREDICTED: uncharacterized protein LOC109346566 [Lupinus angustifolius]
MANNQHNADGSRAENQPTVEGFASFNPRNMIRIWRPDGNQKPPEMKYELVQLMYTNPFVGLDYEDPYNHLTKFFELVRTAEISEAEEEVVFLRIFPLTLIGKAKEWFLNLPPHIQKNWNMVEEKFMNKHFLQGKFMDKKTAISTFVQPANESLYESWDIFKSMPRKCPNHEFDVQTQIHNFINGLEQYHKWILNATLDEVSQKLNDLPRHIRVSSKKQVFRCDQCTDDHDMGQCQTQTEEVQFVNNPPRQYLWNNYPRGGNQFQGNQPWRHDNPQKPSFYPRPNQYQYPTQDKNVKLEDTLNQFMQMTMSNQKNTDASLRNMEIQIGQLTKQLEENQKTTFYANTEVNPRELCNSILRGESSSTE